MGLLKLGSRPIYLWSNGTGCAHHFSPFGYQFWFSPAANLMRRMVACAATPALEDNMPTGTVKWFNKTRGYGFLEPNDHSRTVFVHISAVEQAGHLGLREGQKVTYDLESRQDGRTSAVNLQLD
jgi:CspA family cold shock protein